VELDWFTTLSHQDRPYELAFVRADHDTVPEGYRGRRTQGLIIGLLVPDAAAVDARLRAAGVRVMLPLRDEPLGQRHVMVADPQRRARRRRPADPGRPGLARPARP
jgi:catechol 2,3-dioxygenase-like lactoylglutathione lyase family enzyme